VNKIKLRAWDGEAMHYLAPEETDDAIIFRSKQHFEDDIESVMLGIELDGVNVYEGDVVKLSKTTKEPLEVMTGVVLFSLGTFELYDGRDSYLLLEDLFDIEILGNIYETPELLIANFDGLNSSRKHIDVMERMIKRNMKLAAEEIKTLPKHIINNVRD